MAENIMAFQDGREAAMCGGSRDARRSADWLEGYDQTKQAKDASYFAERGPLSAEKPI